tara:strand:+ start:3396 stop:4085 length:690 start_codon:yes stop_codon:yes gene_type:complete
MKIKSLDVSISNLCNARCPQCDRTNVNDITKAIEKLPLTQSSFEDFERQFPKEVLDDVEEYSFCSTFGDPMMCKDIAKIVQYIIDNSKAKIQITTNGSIRDEDFYWNIGVRCGKRLSIIFDIDGIDEDMHQKYRRGASLKRCLANMSALSMTKSIALSQTILFKHNQDYIEKIKELVKKHGSSNHVFYRSDRFVSDNPDWDSNAKSDDDSKFYFINEQGEKEFLEKADA